MLTVTDDILRHLDDCVARDIGLADVDAFLGCLSVNTGRHRRTDAEGLPDATV